MVVMVHGGPHGKRDYWEYDGEIQLLANRGYAVLQVNYRGSGGYGDSFERAGYREWGNEMIRDIIEGTTSTLNNYSIDKDNVCIYGASYGGYAAMMSAARAPDMFKCAIKYVGIYDLNYAYSESDTGKYLGGVAYPNKAIGTDKAELDKYSPVNLVDLIKANVKLILGEKNARVQVINAEKIKS
jgi:dipeptidyl aminopeptidase/acylaminoacyl peptidase